MRTPVAVGVVGAGPRATALARSFFELPQATLRWICDESSLRRWSGSSERPAWTIEFDDLIGDEQLDAIVFESPSMAGRGRARAALEADKHVYIDGPLALSSADANELVRAAERRGRCLWAQTPALFGAATRRLRGLVEQGALGELFYVHANRYVQRDEDDVDLLWGIGAETVALVLDLLGDEPIELLARDESYLGLRGADVVFAELRFATGIAAHMHLSRLEGDTVERLSVVGSEMTAVLDSSDPQRELLLYASSPTMRSLDGLAVEPGSALALPLPREDATRAACERFLMSVRSPGEVRHGREAATVAAVIEALDRSCSRGGDVERHAPQAPQPKHNVIELRGQ
jgi:predicted dehydrogenase